MNFLFVGMYTCPSHLQHNFMVDSYFDEKYMEKKSTTTNHFSYYKGYYIGLGLRDLGHNVSFLYGELLKPVEHNNIHYIPPSEIIPSYLCKLDAIIFTKHNTGEIDKVLTNCPHMKELFMKKAEEDKNEYISKPYLTIRTCVLPSITYLSEIKVDIGNIFDLFFVQTPEVEMDKSIIKSIIGIRKFYDYKKSKGCGFLKLKNIKKYLDDGGYENHRVHYSEMYVLKDIRIDIKNLIIKKSKYYVCYIGRLRQNFGMVIPMMMKLMNQLGNDYTLIILPGSFNLPNQEKQVKYNPNREHHLQQLKNYFANKKVDFCEKYKNLQAHPNDYIIENVECNIEVYDPVSWGEQYNIISQCDVALNFSPNRVSGYECHVANTKIFDYIASGVPIVSESGCQNNHMIDKYKCGVVLKDIGTVKQYKDAILKIMTTKFDKKKIRENFISNENYLCRAQEMTKIFEEVDDFYLN